MYFFPASDCSDRGAFRDSSPSQKRLCCQHGVEKWIIFQSLRGEMRTVIRRVCNLLYLGVHLSHALLSTLQSRTHRALIFVFCETGTEPASCATVLHHTCVSAMFGGISLSVSDTGLCILVSLLPVSFAPDFHLPDCPHVRHLCLIFPHLCVLASTSPFTFTTYPTHVPPYSTVVGCRCQVNSILSLKMLSISAKIK